MVKTAVKTAVKKRQTNEARLKSQVERYEAFFAELESFIGFVRDDRLELEKAVVKQAKAKEAYDAAKDEVRQLRDSISGAKDALFRLVEPGVDAFLPLFDRMEPADPDKHGEGADEWRKDPISALRLSPVATQILIDADIVCVGQLQDLVMDQGMDWSEKLEGLSDAVAAAIVDKLNDYIFRRGGRP